MMPGSLFSHSYFSAIPYFDKAVHCFLFLVFSILLYNSITSVKSPERNIQSAVILTFIISLAYGIVIEILQNYAPGRSSEFNDVIADGAGAGLGIIIWRMKNRIKIPGKK
jgi:VanZ family protein